jgi:hypothetical protein
MPLISSSLELQLSTPDSYLEALAHYITNPALGSTLLAEQHNPSNERLDIRKNRPSELGEIAGQHIYCIGVL